ncbi:unnamed protein product [Bursaphelenchus okinawaensis]|uniref:Tudor domain-containing protein n=1 Tax=Bursaphelenchus okinawaensis TaxID=465554 RepID=A0A811LCP9_9BILA|nr:unnamed protein product [Bursaphelenchus okinawaensis]CAG9120254.1 unnamed protein product [Bursaphelenchus okinawaensis]
MATVAFPSLPAQNLRFRTQIDTDFREIVADVDGDLYFLPLHNISIIERVDLDNNKVYIKSVENPDEAERMVEKIKKHFEDADMYDNYVQLENVLPDQEYIFTLAEGNYKRGRVVQVLDNSLVRFKDIDELEVYYDVEIQKVRSLGFLEYLDYAAASITEVNVPEGFLFSHNWMRQLKRFDLVKVMFFTTKKPYYGVFEDFSCVLPSCNPLLMGRSLFPEEYSLFEAALIGVKQICKKGYYPYLTWNNKKRFSGFVVGEEEGSNLFVRDADCYFTLAHVKLMLLPLADNEDYLVKKMEDMRVGCAYIVRQGSDYPFFRAQLMQITGDKFIFSNVDFPGSPLIRQEFGMFSKGNIFFPHESLLIPRLYTTITVTNLQEIKEEVGGSLFNLPLTFEFNQDLQEYSAKICK